MTMKSVGSAALKMVEEVRRQFNSIPGLMEGTAKPDYATCVKISTDASLKEMIPPGALVMLTPLVAGTFFGVETLAGVLAGSLVSGVQVCKAMSHSNLAQFEFIWVCACASVKSSLRILHFHKEVYYLCFC